MKVLCVGELRLELVAGDGGLAQAASFAPRAGGAAAAVAMAAARRGAQVSVAGTAGDDAAGRRLRHELAVAGVDVRRLALDGARPTPVALVDASGLHHAGDPLPAAPPPQAVEDADLLFLHAGAADPPDAGDRPLVVLADLRTRRAADVRDVTRAAFLVVVAQADAFTLTGEAQPAAAAAGLLAGGARHAVVCGPGGAVLLGERGLRADAAGPADPVRVAGVLVDALARTRGYPAALAAVLAGAVAV